MALPPVRPPVLPAGALPKTPQAKAWKTATDFETQFLKSMLEQAFSGLQAEGPLGSSGPGAEAWRGLLLDEHARAMSSRGGVGIAPQVYRQTMQSLTGHAHAKL